MREANMQLWAYLRSLREQKGLSTAECAGALRTYEATIYRIENGQTDVRSSLMLRYAALVGASGDELLRPFAEGQPVGAAE
jgi:transcriptional regulator with XRE-family HTH domain